MMAFASFKISGLSVCNLSCTCPVLVLYLSCTCRVTCRVLVRVLVGVLEGVLEGDIQCFYFILFQ